MHSSEEEKIRKPELPKRGSSVTYCIHLHTHGKSCIHTEHTHYISIIPTSAWWYFSYTWLRMLLVIKTVSRRFSVSCASHLRGVTFHPYLHRTVSKRNDGKQKTLPIYILLLAYFRCYTVWTLLQETSPYKKDILSARKVNVRFFFNTPNIFQALFSYI